MKSKKIIYILMGCMIYVTTIKVVRGNEESLKTNLEISEQNNFTDGEEQEGFSFSDGIDTGGMEEDIFDSFEKNKKIYDLENIVEVGIVQNPNDFVGTENSTAIFTVEAEGNNLTYQWQYSADGIKWYNSSVKAKTYKSVLSADRDGRMVRCIVTDEKGNSVISDAAKMIVKKEEMKITGQPLNYIGVVGSTAVFTVEAEGDNLTYQWQYSADGIKWYNSSVKAKTYKSVLSADRDGRMVRCIVTDEKGNSVISDVAKMIVKEEKIKIIRQPESYYGVVNDTVTFEVVAEGSNLSYQWQLSDNGGNKWYNSSIKGSVYTTILSEKNSGRLVKCKITDAYGNEKDTESVKLEIKNEFVEGFFYRNEKVYYRYNNGQYASGLAMINGETYYFNEKNHAMYKGLLVLNEIRYYFDDKDGKAITGLKYVESNGNTYYFQGNKGAYIGLLENEEGLRYFNTAGIMLIGMYTINEKIYFFNKKTGLAENGFFRHPETGQLYYFDGKNGAIVDGFYKIKDSTYYFAKDGTVARGLTKINGKRYYFNLQTGIQETGLISVGYGKIIYIGEEGFCVSGLQEIDGKYYYFDPIFNYAVAGLREIERDTYYFDEENYEAQKGLKKIKNNVYYFENDYKMATGLKKVDNKIYYFDTQGRMCTGALNENNNRYYFAEDTGMAVSGWQTSETGAVYYYDPETYQAVKGENIINGKKYFFYDSGVLQTGIVRDTDGNTYYYYPNGKIGEGFITYGTQKYYFEKNSQIALNGVHDIEGGKYYFNQWGMMKTGQVTVDGVSYFFNYNNGMAITGFVALNNGTKYYYDPQTCEMVTGLKKIGEDIYYFDITGKMQTGYCNVENKIYYFDRTGKAIAGFENYIDSEGKKRIIYADPDTKQLVNGLRKIDNEYYLFSNEGIMKTGVQTVNEHTYYFDEITGKAVKGFYQIQKEKINYFDEDGKRVCGEKLIDGNSYFFSDYGTRLSGMVLAGNDHYILDEETGIAIYGKVTNSVNNKMYMMLEGGKHAEGLMAYWGTDIFSDALTGLVIAGGTTTINNLQYYFDENGERLYGLIEYTTSTGIKTEKYFGENENIINTSQLKNIKEEISNALSSDGWHDIEGMKYYVLNGKYVSGIVQINNKKYGFSPKTNVLLYGLRTIDDEQYYFNKNGEMQTGFITINGETRYFDIMTGKMMTGFQIIQNKKYYFLTNGVMVKGKIFVDQGEFFASRDSGQLKVNNQNYDEDGKLKINYWKTIDGHEYYIDRNGEYLKGLYLINSTYYYFDEYGRKTTGFYLDNGQKKYFDENGLVTGWKEIDNSKYYFNLKDGNAYYGLHNIEEKIYYFDKEGKCKQGFIEFSDGSVRYFNEKGMVVGSYKIENKNYYFNDLGIMQIGLVTLSDKTYYYNQNGVQEYGEIEYGNQTYYFDEIDGEQKSGFIKRNGKIYYYNPNTGNKVVGFYNIKGKKYFFDENTGERRWGFVNKNGKIYYFDDSKEGYLKGLQKIDEKVYYFSDEGIALTGVKEINGTKYYFDLKTGASSKGIYSVNKETSYYFREGGGIYYGLQNIDGHIFYFFPTSGKKVDGLQSIGNKLYYFDEKEGMITNSSIIISGVTYILNSNGEASIKVTNEISNIIQNGLSYLGMAYKQETDEGENLSCSGFVRLLFSDKGIDLKGASFQQCYNLMYNSKYEIIEDIEHAKVGDLIFYTSMSCPYGNECGFWNEIHHVSMYLGDKKVLHSTPHGSLEHPELDCVQIESLAESQQFTPYVIIRIM